MPKIKIDGKEVEVVPGTRVIDACDHEGLDIPRFCYHPGLTPAGNCRMCLVKVSNSRKLEVSCVYPCSEGLEVTTSGPEVEAGRKAVLEYMLINHPLDCPICDKAGECQLQDNTAEHRDGLTRFVDPKVVKDTKDLGPQIKIWGSRCISCTRCVRFCEEVVGTGELAMTQRGDHQVADVHPEIPLDNPMSLNVVDICPVGALIDKDFLYASRVWFTKRTDTVCAGCSKGCNIVATVHQNDIKRVQPRENHAVNHYWMCDAGRQGLDYVKGPNRLKLHRGDRKTLAAKLSAIAARGPARVGILASTYATVEEAYLLKQVADQLGARVGFIGRGGDEWTAKNGWKIEADKTPNRAGVAMVFGAVEGPEAILAGVQSGAIQALLVVNGMPGATYAPELLAAAKKLELLAVCDIEKSPLSEAAHVVIASTTWAEKDGVYVNSTGRVQRIQPLIVSQGQARSDVATLQEILVGLGVRRAVLSTEAVFTEAVPALDYAKVGSQGVVLASSPEATTTVSLGAK